MIDHIATTRSNIAIKIIVCTLLRSKEANRSPHAAVGSRIVRSPTSTSTIPLGIIWNINLRGIKQVFCTETLLASTHRDGSIEQRFNFANLMRVQLNENSISRMIYFTLKNSCQLIGILVLPKRSTPSGPSYIGK